MIERGANYGERLVEINWSRFIGQIIPDYVC